MEGGIAIFLILLILIGGAILFFVLGGSGALASRKGQDAEEGRRQGRAARNTREHPDERARRHAERHG